MMTMFSAYPTWSGRLIVKSVVAVVLANLVFGLPVPRSHAGGATAEERFAALAKCQQAGVVTGTCGIVSGSCDNNFVSAACTQSSACPTTSLFPFESPGCFQDTRAECAFNSTSIFPEDDQGAATCEVCDGTTMLCSPNVVSSCGQQPDQCTLSPSDCLNNGCDDCLPRGSGLEPLGCEDGSSCGFFAVRTIVGQLVMTATDPAFCAATRKPCIDDSDCPEINECVEGTCSLTNGFCSDASPCPSNVCSTTQTSFPGSCTLDQRQCTRDCGEACVFNQTDGCCLENFCLGTRCFITNTPCGSDGDCAVNECGDSAQVAPLRSKFDGLDSSNTVVASDQTATVTQYPRMKRVECEGNGGTYDRETFGCSTNASGFFRESTLVDFQGNSQINGIVGEVIPGAGIIIMASQPVVSNGNNSLAPTTLRFCVKAYEVASGGAAANFYSAPTALPTAGIRPLAYNQPLPQPSPGCEGAACCPSACGDGVIDPGEACDGENHGTCPGSCLGPSSATPCQCACGNRIIDAGETCDDGNLIQGCRLDKPQKSIDGCNNSCQGEVCRDPSRITYSKRIGQLDRLRVHGRIEMPDGARELPSRSDGLGLRLDVGTEAIFDVHIDETVDASAGRFRYRNAAARRTGGLSRAIIRARGKGSYEVHLEAYGDLSKATAHMTTVIRLGAMEWSVDGTWEALARGWRFDH